MVASAGLVRGEKRGLPLLPHPWFGVDWRLVR
jgi:hypothetical protein